MSEETVDDIKYLATVGIPAGIVTVLLAAAAHLVGRYFGLGGQIVFLFGFVGLVILAGILCFVIERTRP